MIKLSHDQFEKIANMISRTIRRELVHGFGIPESELVADRLKSFIKSEGYKKSTGESTSTEELMLKLKKRGKMIKTSAADTSLPKRRMDPLKTVREQVSGSDQSHSLVMAIKRSRVPKKVLTEVQKSTEPMYAGGNTQENLRGVMRTDPLEKRLRQTT